MAKGDYKHNPQERNDIIAKLEAKNKEYSALDKQLLLLNSAGSKEEITQIRNGIITQYGDEFAEQIKGFFEGPKDYDDASVCDWILKNYVAVRLFTSNAYLSKDVTLLRAESENHNPAFMAGLFFRAFGFDHLMVGNKPREKEDDDTYWDYMKNDFDGCKDRGGLEEQSMNIRELPTNWKEEAKQTGEALRTRLEGYLQGLKNASTIFSQNSDQYKAMVSDLNSLLQMMDNKNNNSKVLNDNGFFPKEPAFHQKMLDLKKNATDYFRLKLVQDKNANRSARFEIAEQIMRINPDSLAEEKEEELEQKDFISQEEYAIEDKLEKSIKDMRSMQCGADTVEWMEKHLVPYNHYFDSIKMSAGLLTGGDEMKEIRKGARIFSEILKRKEIAEQKLNDPNAELTEQERLFYRRDRIAGEKLNELFTKNAGKNLGDFCEAVSRKYENRKNVNKDILKTKTSKVAEEKAKSASGPSL